MVSFLIFLVILSWSLLVVLLSGWRGDRRLLSESRKRSQDREAWKLSISHIKLKDVLHQDFAN